MASGTIRVTASELRNQVEKLRELDSQFKTSEQSLEEQETSLSGKWEGEANTGFHNNFIKTKTSMEEFYNLIEKYCIALEEIATKYEKAEAENAERAAQRSY